MMQPHAIFVHACRKNTHTDLSTESTETANETRRQNCTWRIAGSRIDQSVNETHLCAPKRGEEWDGGERPLKSAAIHRSLRQHRSPRVARQLVARQHEARVVVLAAEEVRRCDRRRRRTPGRIAVRNALALSVAYVFLEPVLVTDRVSFKMG